MRVVFFTLDISLLVFFLASVSVQKNAISPNWLAIKHPRIFCKHNLKRLIGALPKGHDYSFIISNC
jgi:hypothetical protein